MPECTVEDCERPLARIFGLENFGNTCYCNSVLQCLFHTRPFREHILKLAQCQRAPRLNTPGTTPHPFALEAAKQELLAQLQQSSKAAAGQTHSSREKPLGLRSFFAASTKRDKTETQGDGMASSAQATFSTTSTGNIFNFKSTSANSQSQQGTVDQLAYFSTEVTLNPHFKGLELGPVVPGQNLPVVGYTADASASVEVRKRMALLQGPIINLNHSLAGEYGMPVSLATSLKDLFECIAENESRKGVASPQFLIDLIREKNELFRSSMQQDAHEFLNFLLNTVMEELDALHQGDWIHKLFEGQLSNETVCMACESVSQGYEKFVDISLDLENSASVISCISQFSASELLSCTNKFYCDKCGSPQEALKRMRIRQAPEVLILHLKRFKYSEKELRNVKLMNRVLYPPFLRLPVVADDFPDPLRLYELSGIIIHLGSSPYEGHYVAVVNTDAGWLLFDDELVEAVDPLYVYKFFGFKSGSAVAYVLFYQRVDDEKREKQLLVDHEIFSRQPETIAPLWHSGCVDDELDELNNISTLSQESDNSSVPILDGLTTTQEASFPPRSAGSQCTSLWNNLSGSRKSFSGSYASFAPLVTESTATPYRHSVSPQYDSFDGEQSFEDSRIFDGPRIEQQTQIFSKHSLLPPNINSRWKLPSSSHRRRESKIKGFFRRKSSSTDVQDNA